MIKFPFLLIFSTTFLKSWCFQSDQLCVIPDGDFKQKSACSQHALVTNINRFCQESDILSDISVTFLGQHTLNTTCEVRDAKNLTLEGQDGAIIKCSPVNDSGFGFINVEGLKISNIEFDGCGSIWDISFNELTGFTPLVLSALLFVNGSNLTVQNVNVSNSKSAGIIIYNVAVNVSVDSCIVRNASSDQLDVMGGNIIAYTNFTAVKTTARVSNSQFVSSGYNIYQGNCTPTSYRKTSFSSGLSLFLGSSLLTVKISHINMSNNSGCNGGNMALFMLVYNVGTTNPTITIEDVYFTHGSAYSGGGLYVTFEQWFPISSSRNVSLGVSKADNYSSFKAVRIVNSNFEKNYAIKVGGGVYIWWKQTVVVKRILDMSIIRSNFTSNSLGVTGSGGLALHYQALVSYGYNPHILYKYRVNLNIYKCTFQYHNPNVTNSEKSLSESSVILVITVPYFGVASTEIASNNCTGLLAVGSTLVIYGSTKIHNNSALTGAGIRLCSDSLMYFTPHMTLTITNNTAEQTGGGIMVYSNCLVNIPVCFYQFTTKVARTSSLLKTVNVTISDNHAPRGGENIFGGSMDYCYLLSVKHTKKFRDQLHVPKNTIAIPSSISSNYQHVCFNATWGDRYYCGKSRNVSIYPGEKVTCSLRVFGQFLGSVFGTVLASAEEGASIDASDHAKAVNITGENLTYTIYSTSATVYDSTRREAKLIFKADMDFSAVITEYNRQFVPTVLRVEFLDCPFGFSKLPNTNSKNQFFCDCRNISAISTCSIDDQTIEKERAQWMGTFFLNNKSYLASGSCPLDYCDADVTTVKATSDGLEQDDQCRYNRTGILCGSCPEGWSLVLGTSECRQHCSSLWLLLIVPFALAGLLLVFFIHYLNLTVTMGTVCGLIFYANVVQDFSITLLSEFPIPALTPVLQVFLSWLNLDLGIATCFYSGMGAFGKTMLQSLFPVYIWVISAVIIVLSNRYISVTRIVGNNAVKVLATLFLLSYSKMLRVTIGSLNFKYIQIWVSDAHPDISIRWILDGNISYFDARYHLSLMILAGLFLIILLPFSLFLLCIGRVYSLSTVCRAFSWIDKLKPFSDAYTGPYKDNARFWTGLLLFARLLLLILHTFDFVTSYNSTPFLIVVTACLILCSLMVFLNGVYKKHHLNMLECFYLLNMAVIFIAQSKKPALWNSIVVHVLMSLAFLTFLGIVGYHIHLKWSFHHLLQKLAFWHRNADLDMTSWEGVRDIDSDDSNMKDDCTEDKSLMEVKHNQMSY